MKIEPKKFMKNGKCSNCGNCCGNLLPLTPTEINIIRIYIKEHDIKEIKHSDNLTCPFRDDENRICTIYEVRPYICKFWRCDGNLQPKEEKRLLKVKRIPVNMGSMFFPGSSKDGR